jgi:uncharacterized protein
MAEVPVHLRPRRPCPICKKLSAQKFHPFCSNRCAQIDLGRWLGEKYSVPSDEQVDEQILPDSDE